LLDAAQLQESDAERKNRKRERAGQKLVEPLYRRRDVESLNPLSRTIPLRKRQEIADGIAIEFFEAGHILGSASIVMTITESGATRTVVFSGDLGPLNSPILNDFDPPPHADLVFQETTYGSRDHRSYADTIIEFRGLLREAISQRKKILIPAFAIGRSQNILYEIARAVRDQEIPPIPVFLDSPMAVEAMETYFRHRELYDADAQEHLRKQDLNLTMDRLTITRTVDESRSLNDKQGPMVIIAGSGMCEGGRIVHHLRNGLFRPTTTVMFVGYQTKGSLGYRLVTGAKEVRIFGERVMVRASIKTLGGFSGHAGRTDLLTWANELAKTKPRWILTHGEPESRAAFRELLQARHGIAAECPKQYDTVEL
jgi:metallo-beta-lactamase family protein